ncbi:hypothetical protein [Acetobacter pasteurianus]|uniref:Uncharacterized protein n=1 Tax=Acetobacter pasteurianus subsp. pasteurianus TaxID=481145 RepID=A0AAC9SRE4_ACEPA|nr:hypothetical protein [Acetobacter pasteurianus]ASC05194.1 hypothetical protein S101468_00927 [Acetobacter pasteurianus subsp. pasteurianus]
MIPNEWEARHKLWEQASVLLASEEDPWISSAILDLSWAERSILAIEKDVAEVLRPFQKKAPIERSSQAREHLEKMPEFCECRAHSKLWIMGLYEVCRVMLNERKLSAADPLKSLFEELKAVRMPFAKHEVRGKKERYFPEPCTPLWGYELGWMVKDYKHNLIPPDAPAGLSAHSYMSRRYFSDKFFQCLSVGIE